MKKLYLLAALAAGVLGASQASALTLDDILTTYQYEGSTWDYVRGFEPSLFPDETTDENGWTLLSGTTTIERGDTEGTVIVKGLFPGAMDLEATFDEENATLTFEVQPALQWNYGSYIYYLDICTGDIEEDADGYLLIQDPQSVVGHFDEEGKLTLQDWILLESSWNEPYTESGYTVYTPNTTAIATVEGESNAQAEFFNLQGVRVDSSLLTPGFYVKRQRSTTSTVLIR